MTNAFVEYDQEGEFLRTVAMYSEFSDQARANFKYRTLYRSTPAMLHTVDGDGLLILKSQEFRAEKAMAAVKPASSETQPATKPTAVSSKPRLPGQARTSKRAEPERIEPKFREPSSATDGKACAAGGLPAYKIGSAQ